MRPLGNYHGIALSWCIMFIYVQESLGALDGATWITNGRLYIASQDEVVCLYNNNMTNEALRYLKYHTCSACREVQLIKCFHQGWLDILFYVFPHFMPPLLRPNASNRPAPGCTISRPRAPSATIQPVFVMCLSQLIDKSCV